MPIPKDKSCTSEGNDEEKKVILGSVICVESVSFCVNWAASKGIDIEALDVDFN